MCGNWILFWMSPSLNGFLRVCSKQLTHSIKRDYPFKEFSNYTTRTEVSHFLHTKQSESCPGLLHLWNNIRGKKMLWWIYTGSSICQISAWSWQCAQSTRTMCGGFRWHTCFLSSEENSWDGALGTSCYITGHPELLTSLSCENSTRVFLLDFEDIRHWCR